MEIALEALLSNADVSRIGGANRYETNAMFSAATFPIEGWASISAPAFTANEPATDIVFSGPAASNTSDGVLYASIQLPHGAEILELKAQVYDVGGNDVTVRLSRANDLATHQELAVGATSSFTDGSTTVSDTTITPGAEIVDNEIYAYVVSVSGVASSNSLFNVKVRYRLGVSTG